MTHLPEMRTDKPLTLAFSFDEDICTTRSSGEVFLETKDKFEAATRQQQDDQLHFTLVDDHVDN